MNNFTFYSPTMFAFGQGEGPSGGRRWFRKEKWSL